MGVPKFYRWISERYPCLSEVVKEYQLPEFDNLYLDMNGIIHTCSHPDDNNPHFRITEEKIFADVFHYIEVLFRMIKPKKAFFMAVDGVAPRAKMNQQRGRRFRSAREAEELIKQAIHKGETLPTEERFDSNCITPGTGFMARLHEALKYFVVKKISTDRLWQGPRIYLSGHETPGEGEHKIMDFIRSEKAKVDYDPNTRHCLYGLDADLIMLGLTTHEPHFSLLREEVKFTGRASQKRSSAPEETTFHLLHLSLMREYLDYEFAELKTSLPFEYNLERIIDDWVLMGFLVGNDFIPHLPHIHIHQECLPLLWSTYKQVLPKLDGYLNEGGFLNLLRFEKYMTTLAQFDIDNFQEHYADMKWAEGKMKQLKESVDGAAFPVSKPISYKTSSLSSEKVGIPTATEFMEHKGINDDGTLVSDDKLLSLDDDEDDAGDDDAEDDDEESSSELSSNDEDATFASEFKKFKAYYYIEKMDFKKVTPAILQSQSHGYIKAIQWILHYYYNGVQSWSWYYPHHYAPYLSDIKNFSDIKLEFDVGEPFLPFQQLMAVLPTASKNLLPTAFQNLMVQDTSPVVDYYPVIFETDLNGKQQEWEAVVLIPFIDEERLLKAMAPLEQTLLPDEKKRNCHGPHLLYEYSPQSLGIYRSPQVAVFPDIMKSHALITELPKDAFVLPVSELRKGLCEGVQDVFYPGFPTLKHIPHTASLTKSGVKVFQMNSRGDNMILHITEQPPPALQTVAKELIGQSVLIGWPHLFEAFVVAISDDETRITLSDMGSPMSEATTSGDRKISLRQESLHMDEAAVWHREVDSLSERYLNRWGTDVGTTQMLVYAKPISGRRYICGFQGKVTLERQWQARPEPFLGQTVVKDVAVFNQCFSQFKTLEDLFLPKTEVFLLGNPHYGCAGKVLDVEKNDDARIRVSFAVPVEPDLTRFRQNKGGSVVRYFPAYSLAQRLGITPHLLSRITGTVYLTQNGLEEGKTSNRINIGLNLKYNKTSKEVPGYTRKVDNDWQYSNKVADILAGYIEGFPEVFDCIRTSNQNNIYLVDDVFKADKAERVTQLTAYLKTLACANITPVSQGTLQVDDEIVKEIETLVSRVQEQNKRKKKLIKMLVRPHLLYQPLEAQAMLIPDPNASYELFDRVINIRDGYSVPLGLRGTVIGILPASKEQEIICEVLFDEEFIDGLTIRSSPNRAYQMPLYAMINITYGERKDMHRVHQPNTPCHAGQGPWKTNTDQLDRRTFGHQQKECHPMSQSAANFPIPQILSRPVQSKDLESYEDMWNQLKGQQKQNSPAKTERGQNAFGAAGGKSSVPAASSLQPLHPPQAWIQRSLDQGHLSGGQPSTKKKSEKTIAQRETNGLKGTDAGKPSSQLITPREGRIASSKPDETRANRTVVETSGTMGQVEQASGNLSQNDDRPPASYGLPVKLDDLFKGLRECCHLHDQPQLMQNKSADNKLHPDVDQSQPEYPVASLSSSFISLMPPGIRPTTMAPHEAAEQVTMQAEHHQQQQQQQQRHQSRAPAASHAQQQQSQMVQPQQLIMHGASWPVQPLMSVPLSQPVRSLLGPVPDQPLQHFQAPPTLSIGNSVRMLNSYCCAKGMSQPQYHCQTGSDGRMRYVVYLQGGVKFVGSWAKQTDQAAESAASVTLYHLNLSATKTSFPVGPEFMASPNSAFTRVQTFQGNTQSNLQVQGVMPGFNMHQQNMAGFPVRPPPSFMNQQFAPFPYHPKDARGGSVHPNNHFANISPGNGDRFLNAAPREQRSAKPKVDWEEKKLQSSSKDDEERDAASVSLTNQFIPTQVLRQNKVPHKMRLSNEDVRLASSSAEQQPTNVVGLSQNCSSSGYHGSIREEAVCEDSAVAAAGFSAALPPRTSKRTRSRIAANFNLNKDQDPSVSQ